MEKTCFVIMGFGKKMDYRNAKEIDLDIIYKAVIKKLFSEDLPQYRLIRADEITNSEIIDVSMYTLLMKADLVIADITTLNENALYELGVRHALRPYSTIIMMQEANNTSIPFDLGHTRILKYQDYGEILDESEASVIRDTLKNFVLSCEEKRTDSPLYTYLPDVCPPQLDNAEYQRILSEAIHREHTVSSYLESAEHLKQASDFKNAIRVWDTLHKMLPNNEYVTQQLAFSYYKSKFPNETLALQKALEIISTLNPKQSLDLETLGITGAIYKRLYFLNQNYAYLDEAIRMYHKGFVIKNDYYNGENYANCLLLKTQQENLENEEIIHLRFRSKEIYQELIALILPAIATGEISYWMYATLSTSYFCIGDQENHITYQKLFLDHASSDWEKESYFSNLEKVRSCLESFS